MARRAHGSESSPCPTPEDEQITVQANEAKALSIISPRRRREQEIDELEAEHRVEVLVKADEAKEIRTAQADNIVTLVTHDVVAESQRDEVDIDIATNNEREHDDPIEEGKLSIQQDEMRKMVKTTILTVQEEPEGRSVESIEEQNEKEASESREQFDEPVEDEVKEAIEDEMPTANSIGYIPALLSKVFDENGYLYCC